MALCSCEFFITRSEYESPSAGEMDQVWILDGDLIGG
jgi:hypothetical protein